WRLASPLNAHRTATHLWVSEPSTAAGSGIPQCAVIGCPGQYGHTSPAALSHTVKTKSRGGAPGAANSSQLLLRSPSVGRFIFLSSSSAIRGTTTLGWLA